MQQKTPLAQMSKRRLELTAEITHPLKSVPDTFYSAGNSNQWVAPFMPTFYAFYDGLRSDPSLARAASNADRPWIGVPSVTLSTTRVANRT